MLIFVSLCATKSMGLNEGAEGRNPIAHNDSSRSITRSRIRLFLEFGEIATIFLM